MSRRKGLVRFKGKSRFEKDDWNAFIKGVADIGDDISKEFLKAEDEIAHKAVKDIRKSSASNFGNGAYAKGWKLEQNGFDFTVYNKDHYQLTHLLEHGHDMIVVDAFGKKKKVGRVNGRAHIAPIQEKAGEEIVKRIDKIVKEVANEFK